MVHWQIQLEQQLRVAIGIRLRQCMVGQPVDGRSPYGVQHVWQRPSGLGIDQHLRVVKICDSCRRLLHAYALIAIQNAFGLVNLHAWAVKHQLSRQAIQLRPGFVARVQVRGRHVGVAHIAHRRGDAKYARTRFAKWHVPQIAIQLKLHVAGLAGQHRIAHIVARLGRHEQGQIAVYLRAVGPV